MVRRPWPGADSRPAHARACSVGFRRPDRHDRRERTHRNRCPQWNGPLAVGSSGVDAVCDAVRCRIRGAGRVGIACLGRGKHRALGDRGPTRYGRASTARTGPDPRRRSLGLGSPGRRSDPRQHDAADRCPHPQGVRPRRSGLPLGPTSGLLTHAVRPRGGRWLRPMGDAHRRRLGECHAVCRRGSRLCGGGAWPEGSRRPHGSIDLCRNFGERRCRLHRCGLGKASLGASAEMA